MTEISIGTGKVLQFTWDVLDSNSYIMQSSYEAIIIDPIDSEELYSFAAGLRTANIFLTHAHYDHICGLTRIRDIICDTRVICSKICNDSIQNPRKNLSFYAHSSLGFQGYHEKRNRVSPFACSPADYTFEKYDFIEVLGHSVELYEFRGHSADSMGIVLDGKYFFSGDSLLNNPTTTRLPGGNRKVFIERELPLFKSWVKKIELVFPGHGMPGDIISMTNNNKLI